MYSKLKFDVGENNRPLITFDIKLTDDLRDKIAKQCIEVLGGESSWFRLTFNPGNNEPGLLTGVIVPISPEEIEHEIKIMSDRISNRVLQTAMQHADETRVSD